MYENVIKNLREELGIKGILIDNLGKKIVISSVVWMNCKVPSNHKTQYKKQYST